MAMTARHWPEVTYILDAKSATLLELLAAYGGPAAVRADQVGARQLMKRVGRGFLAEEKIEAVIGCAKSSFAVPQLDTERDVVMAIATEARRNQQAALTAVRQGQARRGRGDARFRGAIAAIHNTDDGGLVRGSR